ncbi:KdsC family phosphatase [Ornithobacterium rhinotracheale]|uniref:KdsC family phosphatase n=1 Tax=Ornithobacterium rhinotracheale TaxID=28251 RepID=UPI00129C1175|nr:HAD-IIIA family hydrolase [Ornithobacterium rhinotracheale]MRI62415.1 HAD-IIIA family hydrolase [Ornithobacterium rhinotracheale]
MNLPKLIATDIDGVWTDGGMFYDQTDIELKKFNTYDSAGVLFAKHLNIPVAIITGEDTNIVKRRAEKLKVDDLFLGAKNKIEVLNQLCRKYSIEKEEVAYIGDDINDIEILEQVGLSACPSSAPKYIQELCKYICNKKGGEGAFREFVEHIIGDDNIRKIIRKIRLKQQ